MNFACSGEARIRTGAIRVADDSAVAAESVPVGRRRESESPSLLRPEAVPVAEPNIRKKRSPRVLIVEDTVELAEVIAATLERVHIQVLHETHVERALDLYASVHPEIILLDIGLPDKTGWKLLDAIKERAEENRPIVIVITAHDDPANRLMGKLQGVHSYLIKPFTPDEVERVVGDALVGRTTEKKFEVDPNLPVDTIALSDLIREILEGNTGNPPDHPVTPSNNPPAG